MFTICRGGYFPRLFKQIAVWGHTRHQNSLGPHTPPENIGAIQGDQNFVVIHATKIILGHMH